MYKSIMGLTVVAGALAFSANAQALVIADSFANAHETTEISQTGALSMFDSSLGTLDSVTLEISGESISTTQLLNTASGAQNFQFDSILNYFLDLSSVGVTSPSPAFTTDLASTGGFVSLASGATLNLGTKTDSSSWAVTLTGADLASFIGVGDFSVGCSTISGSNFAGGGGNINNIQSTTAKCDGNVSYAYTAAVVPPPSLVPAPASLLLMGIGLLGFVASSKRKTS